MTELTITPITNWVTPNTKEILYFNDLNDYKKIVEACFMLPNGDLVAMNDICVYVYQRKE